MKGSLKHGLTKKEGFKAHTQGPPETSKGMRPKHDNPKVSRRVNVPKG